MSTISRIAGWLLTLSGVAFLALIGALWLDGKDIVRTAGQAWVELHPLSLTQVRHLALEFVGLDTWNGYVGAVLAQPTWLALAELSALGLVLGLLFLTLGHPAPERQSGRPLAA